MKPFKRSARALSLALCAAMLMGTLWSCGGGGDTMAGGVGSGGTGVAEGNISGFGSVIIDGVTYDDSAATVQTQDATGALVATDARLGQRVRLSHDGQGKAQAIEVLPQLLGPVTQAPADGWIRVLDQWVQLDADTVLADYAQSSEVGLGDEVQVHGTWEQQADRGMVLHATRLERRAAAEASAPLLVSGFAQSTDASAGTFRLNRANGLLIAAPGGVPLPNVGQGVAVWVARGDWSRSPLPALRLRPMDAVQANGTLLTLSGPVRELGGELISIQGITAHVVDGALLRGVQPGTMTQLSLERVDGEWQLRQLRMRREPEDLGGRVELKQVLPTLDWSVRDADGALPLLLRGTRVRVPDALVTASGCAALPVPVLVRVTAQRGPQPLLATSLQCSAASAAAASAAAS